MVIVIIAVIMMLGQDGVSMGACKQVTEAL